MAVAKKTLKVGQKCKVVRGTSGHNLPMGSIVTINRISGSVYYIAETGNSFYKADLDPMSMTKPELLKDIKKHEEEIQELKSKIEFIEEVGAEEYDDDQFKVYNILKMIEDPATTKIQKSKLISQLIK